MKELIIKELINYLKNNFSEDCKNGKVKDLYVGNVFLNDDNYDICSFNINGYEIFIKIINKEKMLLKVNNIEFYNGTISKALSEELIKCISADISSKQDELKEKAQSVLESVIDVFNECSNYDFVDEQWFIDWQDALNEISVK